MMMRTLPRRRLLGILMLLNGSRPGLSLPFSSTPRRKGRTEETGGIHPSLLPLHSLVSPITRVATLPPDQQRVRAYCLSDLHADGDNMNWIAERCVPTDDSSYNILIVPGDVANSIPAARRCLSFLASRWDAVCYCVGNHEAWVKEAENDDLMDNDPDETTFEPNAMLERTSVDQLVDVLKVAREAGVHVGPLCVPYNTTTGASLWLVPLQSFYHSAFDTEPDLQDPALLAAEQRRSFAKRWQDFRNMKWPIPLTSHREFTQGDDGRGGSWTLATAFGDLNRCFLEDIASTATDADTILSFSHYVPRLELSPEKRFLIDPSLARVIGSNRLEQDIRRLQPNMHLFGHTHIPIGMTLDGIRYAQWPLGYPKEATLQCRTVAATGPMLVFDSHLPNDGGLPPCTNAELSHWSRHYQQYQRDPNNLEPSPWLRERLERIGRRR